MGSFFTNVQVKVRDGVDLKSVLAALSAWLGESQRWIPVGPDDVCHREVVVRGDDRWIAVYDQATESQDGDALVALGCALSAGGGAAVGVLVHDSDILHLWRFEDGDTIDAFDSTPDYFEPASEEEAASVRGDVSKWRSLLAPGHDEEQLRAAFDVSLDEDQPFAEDVLAQVADVLEMDHDLVMLGHTYLDDAPPLPSHRLRFKRAAGAEQEVTRAINAAPALLPESSQTHWEGAVGDSKPVDLSLQSVGGAGRGLSLAVWGPAIDQGLVRPRSAIAGDDEVAFTLRVHPDAGTTWVAVLPSFAIPVGVDPQEQMRLFREDPTRAFALLTDLAADELAAAVDLEALAPGKALLMLGAVPNDNVQGQCAVEIDVQVAGPVSSLP